MLAAYEDPQVFDMANELGLTWEEYDAAVMKAAEWIFNAGGLDAYAPGTFSNEELNSFFISTQEPGGTATRMYADYPGGAIYGPDGKGNMVMIIDENGAIQDYNYALVYNTYLDRFGYTAGQALFNAGLAHEKTHSQQYKTEGFATTPDGHRKAETAAYKAGMEKKKEALQDLGCE